MTDNSNSLYLPILEHYHHDYDIFSPSHNHSNTSINPTIIDISPTLTIYDTYTTTTNDNCI